MPSNSNVPCFVASTVVTELSTKKSLSGATPYSNGKGDRMAVSTSSSTCDGCCSDACSLAYSTDLRSYINSGPNSQFASTTSDDESTLNNNDLMSDVAASSTTAPCENAEGDHSKSKLVRSFTFTVNTTSPYLKSLGCQLQSNFNSIASNSHSAMNRANCSISDVFRSSNTAAAQSPVVSDGITRILQKYGDEFGDTLIDYDLIKEQIMSLNEMRCMLKEYHRLQLDELKLRQARELQTIETQLSLMENLLNKINLHSSNSEQQIFINQLCETASNDSYYVSLSPTKTLKPRPSLTSEGKSFCHLHQDCLPEHVTRELLDNSSSDMKKFSKLTSFPFKAREKLLALVKGFFIRRLMRTNYVKSLLAAIRDTTSQIDALNKENLLTESDSNFKRSLFYQLQFERFTFYRVFFEISTSERMKIIARDRIRDMAKINTDEVKRNPEPSLKNLKISSATLKRLARKGNANSQTPSVCSGNKRQHLISVKASGRTGWYSQSADDLRNKISKSNGGDSVSMLSIASSRQWKTPHKQKNDRRPWR
ncbi:Centriolar coiled-coil protein [Trichinella spiralis]|uniref:Centriolar coiled-coil protein n=1 Tax=Trichinella spiralis TaxID=6334 RepID=A0A0V1BV47_TRISP|nr:Centriolar coiled-coil protein [Trichinella spiralis]